jgi:hypothetical protein
VAGASRVGDALRTHEGDGRMQFEET